MCNKVQLYIHTYAPVCLKFFLLHHHHKARWWKQKGKQGLGRKEAAVGQASEFNLVCTSFYKKDYIYSKLLLADFGKLEQHERITNADAINGNVTLG